MFDCDMYVLVIISNFVNFHQGNLGIIIGDLGPPII